MDEAQFQPQNTSIGGDQKKIKPTSHQTLKNLTKLLFSLSLFSFFLTNLPFHFHFSSHFFNQPIDKNSMFLLSNALLVFLANYSGLFNSLSSSPKHLDTNFRFFDFGLDLLHKPSSIHSQTPEGKKHDSTQQNTPSFEQQEDELLGERLLGGEETGEVEDMIQEEEDDEEEGNCGVMSDEELNRKFDEFIKRMKEEIVLDDAPRTLVVV